MLEGLIIRKVSEHDYHSIWNIIRQVIRTGDAYVFKPNSRKEEMLDYWCGKDKHTYVAVIDEQIAGTFVIKENQPGLGAHVANASFMTLPSYSGKGIGKIMGKHCLEEAKKMGFKFMQFNIVVKSNERAIRLWQKLGFEIIGEVPEAFNHRKLGFVNAYIMWKRL